MNLGYLLGACAIGMAFAAQPAINAVSARGMGSAIPAAALSVAITMVACLALMLVARVTPSIQALTQLPWWIVFGGLIGVCVVAGSATIVPVTGVTLFFVCLIAGQLFGSIVLDHFGAFGLQVDPVSWKKIAGVVLALLGVVLVRFG